MGERVRSEVIRGGGPGVMLRDREVFVSDVDRREAESEVERWHVEASTGSSSFRNARTRKCTLRSLNRGKVCRQCETLFSKSFTEALSFFNRFYPDFDR